MCAAVRKTTKMGHSTPVITSLEDIKRYDGQLVSVEGTYEAVPRPVRGIRPPNEKETHAVITIDTGLLIFLEPIHTSKAHRGFIERARFDRTRVTATGILRRVMPSPGQGLGAPCLSPVLKIRKAGR